MNDDTPGDLEDDEEEEGLEETPGDVSQERGFPGDSAQPQETQYHLIGKVESLLGIGPQEVDDAPMKTLLDDGKPLAGKADSKLGNESKRDEHDAVDEGLETKGQQSLEEQNEPLEFVMDFGSHDDEDNPDEIQAQGNVGSMNDNEEKSIAISGDEITEESTTETLAQPQLDQKLDPKKEQLGEEKEDFSRDESTVVTSNQMDLDDKDILPSKLLEHATYSGWDAGSSPSFKPTSVDDDDTLDEIAEDEEKEEEVKPNESRTDPLQREPSDRSLDIQSQGESIFTDFSNERGSIPMQAMSISDQSSKNPTSNASRNSRSLASVQEEADLNSNPKKGFTLSNRPSRIRAIFFFFGLCLMGFSTTSLLMSFKTTRSSARTLHDGANEVEVLSSNAAEITLELQETRASTIALRDDLVQQLHASAFCPGQSSSNNSLVQLATNTIPALEQLGDFVAESVGAAQAASSKLSSFSKDLRKATNEWDVKPWHVLVVLLPVLVLPALMMTGTTLAVREKEVVPFTWFLSWIVLPTFTLFIMATSLCACFLLIGASVNVDYCVPPGFEETIDHAIIRTLRKEGYDQSTFEGQAAFYYISECKSSSNPFEFIPSFSPLLDEAETMLEALGEDLVDHVKRSELEAECRRSEYDSVSSMVSGMEATVLSVAESLTTVEELSSCDDLSSLYADIFYKGVCTDSIDASMWMFFGFFGTSMFGLILIFLRSAYHKTVFVEGHSNVVDDVPEMARRSKH